MHIVIVGAGGIGGYFGARLIEGGAHVSFVARGAHAAAIRERGLRVTSALGDATVRPHAVADDPAALGAADLVLFAVKLPDAESAAKQLKPLLRAGTVVLPLQNGVDVVDLLAAQVGAPAVAVGAALISARIAAPGVVEHLGPFARLRFGPLQPAQSEAVRAFHVACQRAKIDAELLDNPRRAIWEKFVFLVGMSSLTALTRQAVGVVRDNPELRRLLRQVMGEAAALARAEGVPLDESFVDAQIVAVDKLPAGIKASMLGDLLAGKPLELPWLAGAVVRRSERHGLQADANRFVAAALAPYVNGAPPRVTTMRVPISFEFFPPNTPVGDDKLKTVVAELGRVKPEFFSVTYGAGGSTRDKTLATVSNIAALGHEAAPHLSCVGSTRAGIAQILGTYRAQNIRRLVALRGDLPSGTATVGEFRYAAELIRFIRETQGADWHIEVACYPEVHPQQRYAKRDLQFFADKVAAGASSAITQFFFNADAYFHFVDEARKAGVTVPIVPGIMPILNYARIAQFAARDGIDIPRWVALKMEGFMDDTESIRAFGLDVVTNLCRRLIDGGAPGIHFYTLNQSALSLEICRRLAG